MNKLSVRVLKCYTVLVLIVSPYSTLAQTPDSVQFGGEKAAVVKSSNGLVIVKNLAGEINPRSQFDNHKKLHRIWYTVQDSSLGVVFKEPSGLKESDKGDFDGDVDLHAGAEVHAVEVVAITLNVWNEVGGIYSFTDRHPFKTGDEESFDPRWIDYDNATSGHMGSVIFISQVRLATGKIRKADRAPIVEFIGRIAQDVDPSDENVLERDIPVWLDRLLKQFRNSG